MDLTILQLNVQGSKEVAGDLRKRMENRADIMVLQEPYSLVGRVKGYAGLRGRVFQPRVFAPKAAIIINNPELDVLQLDLGNSSHVVAVQITAKAHEFYLVSVYFQFSHSVEPYLTILDDCIAKIRNNNAKNEIIICADVNAQSATWFSRLTDDRGEKVEDFIIENNLIVLNQPSRHTTYASHSGTSNIDVTLTTPGIAGHIRDWHIEPEAAISDHNAILMKISTCRDRHHLQEKDLSFNVKRADWELFDEEVRRRFDPRLKSKLTLQPATPAVALMTGVLQDICRRTIGTRKYRVRTVPWWNDNLTDLRKEVQKTRAQLSRARRLNLSADLEQAKNKYKKCRAQYVRLIRQSKLLSWRGFVMEKGNSDPWGLLYKILRNKIRNDYNTFHAIKEGGDSTLTWCETATKLLNKMVPDKATINDDDKRVIEEVNDYSNANMEPLISVDEIDGAIKRVRNKKAPGMDGVNPEIIKRLWHTDKEIISILFNNCLRNSSFPEQWRQGKLRPILKDVQSDPTQLGSYRPIALLPVIGKIFERIIVDRVQRLYEDKKLNNNRQFGFRTGRGTEDALQRIIQLSKNNEKKYVTLIFFDIAGAFDNLWWPAILKRVSETQCSSQLYDILKQYFSKRKMMLTSKCNKAEKEMTRGCPQGSIIGPQAWNWAMDDLLNQLEVLEARGIYATAYADDLAIVIYESSRAKIEEKATQAIDTICKWCTQYKLQIAPHKTKAILVKGSFHRERMPRLMVLGRKIDFVDEHKYLGVYIDRKLSFLPHLQHLRNKIATLVVIIRKTVHEEWGLRRGAYTLLYKCLYLPIIVYGAEVWYERVSHSHAKRILNSIQRKLLIVMTKACRTASTAALQVIAGCMPLELEVIQKALTTRIRKRKYTTWNTYLFNPDDEQPEENLKEEKDRLKEELINQWQRSWNDNMHGRTTYKFIPNVRFYLNNKWFQPNKSCVDMITGYGSINKTLFERNCIQSPLCPDCTEVEEDVEHLLFHCPLYNDIRIQSLASQEAQTNWSNLINSEDKFRIFYDYVTRLFKKRKIFVQQSTINETFNR